MLKQSFLYALSVGLNKGSVLLFFPLLTSFLTLEAFGQWSLLIIISNLLVPVISLNGFASILREGSLNLKVGLLLLKKYIQYTVLIGAIISVLLYQIQANYWIYYSVLIATAEALLMLILTYFRIINQSLYYFIIILVKSLMLFILIVYAKYNLFDLDVLLYYHFLLLIAYVLTVYMFIYFKHNMYYIKTHIDMKPILLFSLVLIPHGLSQWIMSSSDRLILEVMINSESVGIYSLAYNLGMILMLLNSGISLVLPTNMIQKYNVWIERDYDNIFIKYYTFLSIVLFLLIITIYYFDKNNFHILGYYGDEMLPLITVIYISIYFLGLYYFYANYLFYYRKASLISRLTFYSALLNIVLSVLLIYQIGVIGAALATLIAYIYYLYKIKIEAEKVESAIKIKLKSFIVLFLLMITLIYFIFYTLL